MLVPMQLQFNIELNNDELIHKVNVADNGHVVVNSFLLWILKLTPKDIIYDKFINNNNNNTLFTFPLQGLSNLLNN